MTDEERADQLEDLLDLYGSPAALLEDLATIASEKADHVRSITGMQDIELGALRDPASGPLAAWDRATKAYRFCHDRNVPPFSTALKLAEEVYYKEAQKWSAAFGGGMGWPEDVAGGG